MKTSKWLLASACILFGSVAFAETKTALIPIEGMSCAVGCVGKVEKQLDKVAGIEKSKVKKGSAKITYDDEKTSEEELVAAIKKAGYKVKN